MARRARTTWIAVLAGVVALLCIGLGVAALRMEGMVQSLGDLPVRFKAGFVDWESKEPIEGVLVFIGWSEEAAADADNRARALEWLAENEDGDMPSLGLARSRADGVVDVLFRRTFCHRSDEPYRTLHDTDRVEPYQSVGGVWIQHPEYGEIVMSTRSGTLTGPTHHRNYDRGPWAVDLGTIELQRTR